MKIGILGNLSKVKTEETLQELIAFLQGCGYETVRFATSKEIDGVDVVLILGGDGAILHASVEVAKKNIKIIR